MGLSASTSRTVVAQEPDHRLIARHVIFQMAEVAIPRELFRAILERIG